MKETLIKIADELKAMNNLKIIELQEKYGLSDLEEVYN